MTHVCTWEQEVSVQIPTPTLFVNLDCNVTILSTRIIEEEINIKIMKMLISTELRWVWEKKIFLMTYFGHQVNWFSWWYWKSFLSKKIIFLMDFSISLMDKKHQNLLSWWHVLTIKKTIFLDGRAFLMFTYLMDKYHQRRHFLTCFAQQRRSNLKQWNVCI